MIKKAVKLKNLTFVLGLIIAICFLFLPFFNCEHGQKIYSENIVRYTFICGENDILQSYTLGGILCIFVGGIKGIINIKNFPLNKSINEDTYLEYKDSNTKNSGFIIFGIVSSVIFILVEFFVKKHLFDNFNLLNGYFYLNLILVCLYFIVYIKLYILDKKIVKQVLWKEYYEER